MEQTKAFIVKSNTNGGDFAKQYFRLAWNSPEDLSLIVRKYVLSNDRNTYENYQHMREYKGKGLYFQVFSIKLSTLDSVLDWMNEICIPPPKCPTSCTSE